MEKLKWWLPLVVLFAFTAIDVPLMGFGLMVIIYAIYIVKAYLLHKANQRLNDNRYQNNGNYYQQNQNNQYQNQGNRNRRSNIDDYNF